MSVGIRLLLLVQIVLLVGVTGQIAWWVFTSTGPPDWLWNIAGFATYASFMLLVLVAVVDQPSLLSRGAIAWVFTWGTVTLGLAGWSLLAGRYDEFGWHHTGTFLLALAGYVAGVAQHKRKAQQDAKTSMSETN